MRCPCILTSAALAVAILGSSTVGSGIARAEQPQIGDVSSPVVNTYITSRTRVNDISLDEILKQLVPLAERSHLEESWIYLHDDAALLEVGYLEDAEHVSYDSSFVLEFVDQEITQLHIHPPQRKAEEELEERLVGLSSARANYERQVNKTVTIVPSGDDIFSMMLMYQKAVVQNPEIQLRHFVASEHGVTEFSLTEEGKRYVQGLDKLSLKDFKTDFSIMLNDVYDNLDVCASETHEDPTGCPAAEKEDIMDYVLSKVESPYVEIRFTPKEDM